MLDWLTENEALLLGLGIFSVVSFVASLVIVPALIIRLPADYFAESRRGDVPTRHPALRLALLIAKNTLGAIVIIVGIILLPLPGQGVLTILVGIILLDFPGKYALERRLIGRPAVLEALNWIRAKANRPPLVLH